VGSMFVHVDAVFKAKTELKVCHLQSLKTAVLNYRIENWVGC
jgi:hypothetical protein